MQDTQEDCSWQEVYRLNSVMLNSEEEFDTLELDEIETIVMEFKNPLKPFVEFEIPELRIKH